MKKYCFYNLTNTLLFALLLAVACKGQVKTNGATNTETLPKLLKTQGSTWVDNVHCGIQDKAGDIWFGTTGEGIYRYDGKTFTQFTVKDGLNSNCVWSILEDKMGSIWVGTDNGLCRYDPSADKVDGKIFTSIAMTNPINLLLRHKLSEENDVSSILQDKNGIIWFGTTAGVYCYNPLKDGHSFTRFLDDKRIVNDSAMTLKSVQCLLEDKNGAIWFGSGPSAFEGIGRYDGKNVTKFKPQKVEWVRNIIEDKNGNILFATRHNGVLRYDGKAFSTFEKPAALINGSLNRVLEDKKGVIWYASDYGKDQKDTLGGVWCYNGVFSVKISDAPVFFMLEDKAGNLWFGARDTGLCRYDGKNITNFLEK
ncbi:MAG: hypothetical protein RLZZ292_2220 [Bacteroidota bacterium]|jgi:ligand-binding sensor domain-containing protein